MHIPDGFLSPPVWATLDVAALPAAGWVARRAQRVTEERSIPLMGVMGAFVFAAQMINFPVALGTSGHLVGGALLAIALGPAAASVVMTAILVVQAFVFQDGGIMALGANVFNMAIAGVLAGYLPYRMLGSRWRAGAIFLAGAASVLTSAMLAISELWISGVRMPAEFPWWLTIVLFGANGLLEGAITVAAVRAIGRLNPDWMREPERSNTRAWTVLGVSSVLLVVFGVLVASSAPDAIQRLTNYSAPDLETEWLRKAGAGLAGMLLIFAACALTGRFFARFRARHFRTGQGSA